MKKFLKSRKRWIAFFLAFLLVATTCITSSDAFLWATGENETTETEQADNGPVEETVEMDVEEEEPEKVEGEADTEGTEKVEGETDTEGTEKVEGETDTEGTETEEVSDGENQQALVDEETPEEEVTEENQEIVEEAVTYGYAVYYYYDGVEDEDGRVEKEGALGDAIFTSAEKEVVYDGKDYVLDHVENEEGKISEDATQNVVKVYYVLAEEVEKVERSVKVVSSLKGVETVEEGTSVTLTAKLTGFDDVEYEIQWQRSEDGKDWEDVDGANDTEYTFDITEETEGYLWRVSVSTSEA